MKERVSTAEAAAALASLAGLPEFNDGVIAMGNALADLLDEREAREGRVRLLAVMEEHMKALQRRVEDLTALRVLTQEWACKGYRHWDADEDSKAGKILGMLGGNTGYAPDVDAIRKRLDAKPEPVVPHGG